MGNLIKDLADRKLLDETLIVLTTEFGRSPVIKYNAGRDHHPAVFSSVLAGGGIKGGQFYGSPTQPVTPSMRTASLQPISMPRSRRP